MRWQGQLLDDEAQQVPGQEPAAPLIPMKGLLRSVCTPEFEGITFHEVVAKTALNKVPAQSNMPFRWTVNPLRGCSHACAYCFARRTHEYLDLDSGSDFDSQIVVKTNVAEVLRAELSRPSWPGEHVALGTNTDPYQRAEGRYRLMPGIIRALADSGTPFSILTKGPLLKRDVPLLVEASEHVPVSVAVSLAIIDPELQQRVEPGTPDPRARLSLIRSLAEAGLDVSVLAMPILPWLTDSQDHLDSLHQALAEAGASSVTTGALHLRPGAREWFLQWLAQERPDLVAKYRRLYSGPKGFGSYASKEYRTWLGKRAAQARRRHGFDDDGGRRGRSRQEGDRRASWRDRSRPEGTEGGATVLEAAAAPSQPALF